MVPERPLTRVLVFGREPCPGRTKTRLARSVGADRAARVSDRMLRHTLDEAAAVLPTRLLVAEEPTPDWVRHLTVPWAVQVAGDLGRRMDAAFRVQAETGDERILLVGADVPELDRRDLLEAARALDEAEVVLGPAPDGGYWLVGQRAPVADVFSGVPWSSPETLARTLERCALLDRSVAKVRALCDLDTLADLAVLARRGRVKPALWRALADDLGCLRADS